MRLAAPLLVLGLASHSAALLLQERQHDAVDGSLMSFKTKKLREALQRWEQLEDWNDSGMSLAHTLGDSDLKQLSHQILADDYKAELKDLVNLAKTRYVAHAGNRKAADHILAKFRDYKLQAKEHPFMVSQAEARGMEHAGGLKTVPMNGNIAGFKRGKELPDEVIVIGAHYDSINWDTAKRGLLGHLTIEEDAPGVDDNASGVALVLALAKVLANKETKRSILFVAFNGEELGLLGSKAFVEGPVASGEYGEVKYALIADEVAFPGRDKFKHRAIFETSGHTEGTKQLVDTLAHMTKDREGELKAFEVNWHGFGSDHMSFLNAGIPAVLLIERDDEWNADTHGHSSRDVLANVDVDFGAKMCRLMLRTALALSNPK